MSHQTKHMTAPGTPSLATPNVTFTIDVVRVQGPARERLRKRFGPHMRNLLSGLSGPLDAVARIGLVSDTGSRPRVEDSAVAVLAHLGDDTVAIPVILAAVADGVGGHADGDLASAIVIQTLAENVVDEMAYDESHKLDKVRSTDNVEDLLMEAISKAHSAVKEGTDEGGTTLTCALIIDRTAYVAHVGDSRAYLLPAANGAMEQITRDHRLVREWVEHGLLKEEQLLHHPLAHILNRSLGRAADQCQVDLTTRSLTAGSRLLLCTDGVSDALNHNELWRIVSRSDHPQETCERLIKAALARNVHDDVTALMVELPG